ncbi:MAG: thioredoxin [Candidatus Rokubacteria bacterium]|nr:thioredoxin [Candidatus Rokubacteria bacterium]MBI3827860.1 thioredoxin [Candidatus Rokubacteria bacterium]
MDIRCPACGATNRVPDERRGQPARCGKCHAPLAVTGADADAGATARPIAVSDADFDASVITSPVPVLLDCWADWCGPCHMLAPTIDALARDYAGRVRVAKLDVDANPRTAGMLGVQGIPALFFFRDGRVVDRLVGAHPRGAIAERLNALLGASSPA